MKNIERMGQTTKAEVLLENQKDSREILASKVEDSTDQEIQSLIDKLERRIAETKAKSTFLHTFEKELIVYDQMMIDIARMSVTDILEAFYDYKDSDDPNKQKVWHKVVNYIKDIKKNRYNPFSYWSLTSKNIDNYSVLDVFKRKKMFLDMKERGFENPEEVDIQNITINTILKNPIKLEEVSEEFKKIRNSKLTHDYELDPDSERETLVIAGTISLDTFLLTEGLGEFEWQARVVIEPQQGAGLDLEKDQSLDTEIYFDIDFDGKGLYQSNYENPGVAIMNRFNHMSSKFFKENSKKYGLEKAWVVKKVGKDGSVEEKRYVLEALIKSRLEKKITDILKRYIKTYVEPGKFDTWETMSTKFIVDSEISTKTEEEIDEMFKQGLQTGEFDSMLLYVGEGAQKFLEITAGEDYRIMNKEFLLIRDNLEKIAGSLEDSHIYELGPGNGKKSREILEKIIELSKKDKDDKDNLVDYTPVDINPMMIYATAQELADLKDVKVQGLVCDFRKIADKVAGEQVRSFLLLGNTLGNGDKEYQIELLNNIKEAMRPGEKLIVGVQVKSDLEKVLPSYQNEEAEKFVKLMLKRFGIEEDETTYKVLADEENNQLVMTLTFNKDKEVNYKGVYKKYEAGESITITVSHKYEDVEIEKIAQQSGLKIVSKMENNKKDYLLVELEK